MSEMNSKPEQRIPSLVYLLTGIFVLVIGCFRFRDGYRRFLSEEITLERISYMTVEATVLLFGLGLVVIYIAEKLKSTYIFISGFLMLVLAIPIGISGEVYREPLSVTLFIAACAALVLAFNKIPKFFKKKGIQQDNSGNVDKPVSRP